MLRAGMTTPIPPRPRDVVGSPLRQQSVSAEPRLRVGRRRPSGEPARGRRTEEGRVQAACDAATTS